MQFLNGDFILGAEQSPLHVCVCVCAVLAANDCPASFSGQLHLHTGKLE